MLLSHQQGLCLFSKPDVTKASAHATAGKPFSRAVSPLPLMTWHQVTQSQLPIEVEPNMKGSGQEMPHLFQSWGETSRKSPKPSHWKRQREKTARCRDSRGRGWQAPRCPACGGQKSLRCLRPLSPCSLRQQA